MTCQPYSKQCGWPLWKNLRPRPFLSPSNYPIPNEWLRAARVRVRVRVPYLAPAEGRQVVGGGGTHLHQNHRRTYFGLSTPLQLARSPHLSILVHASLPAGSTGREVDGGDLCVDGAERVAVLRTRSQVLPTRYGLSREEERRGGDER
jgi:hypothetical protein